MSKHTYNNIGRKLYQLRLELGLTQNGRIEREECNCSVNLLDKILQVLGKEIDFK